MKPGLSPAYKVSKDLRVLRLTNSRFLRLTLEPLRGPLDSLNGAESSCWSASGPGALKTVTADYDRFCAGVSRSPAEVSFY